MKSSQIREDLKHVRSVHFALLIVSGTMLYLIIAAWSRAPELYAQLFKLTTFLKNYQTTGVPLKEVDPKKAADISDEVLRTVQKATGTKLAWADSSSGRKSGTGPATDLTCRGTNLKTQAGILLMESINHAISAGCQFSLPVISEDQAKLMSKETATPGGNQGGVGFLTDAYLKDFSVLHDLNGDSGIIVLARTFFPSGDDRTPPPPGTEWPTKFQVGLRSDTAAFSQNWLQQRFPAVQSHPELLAVTSEDALRLVAEERTKTLESFKASFLGVEVKPAHIGTVGPVIIVSVLLYLFAYLRHLSVLVPEEARSPRESVDSYSPWLGATKGLLPFAGTLVSVTVIPSLIILLSLWRLTGLAIVWSVVIAMVGGFAPGMLITRVGSRLAVRKIETETPDKSSAVAT